MKTIVMTGATKGIGLAAADSIRRVSDVHLLFGARSKSTASADSLPLDLARLASVRAFAASVDESLGETSIDGLVLNAGTQFPDVDGRTEDGFERTFAVNHLAHYLLLRLLMPRLASGAVVEITTSDTHDPKVIGLAPPEHADARLLAKGKVGVTAKSQASRPGMRAYATSKLCNLLTARALATSTFSQQRALRVIAFNPGLTPGTQLLRNQPRALRFVAAALIPILSPIMQLNTIAGGGDILADLVLGRLVPPAGRLYASEMKRHLTWPDPSDQARDDAAMAKLWRDSAELVGLPEQG